MKKMKIHNRFSKRSFITAVALFLLLSSMFQPPVHASDEQNLIKNGGFEEGAKKGSWYPDGWTVEGVWEVLRTVTGGLPPHGGMRCAKIGSGHKEGVLYQIVKIPAKSGAILTFWYNLEKGARLKVSIRGPEGGEVSKTFGYEASVWRSASLKVGREFSDKEVRVEFIGWGYQEIVYEERLIVTPWGAQVVKVPVTKDYGAWIDDVSLIPFTAVYEAEVLISGLPMAVSTKLMVDGRYLYSLKGNESKVLGPYDLGEKHMISVEEVVPDPMNPDVRYRCRYFQREVSEDSSLRFEYRPEYRILVESEVGDPRGAGWYEAGSEAIISVEPKASSWIAILGGRWEFVGWHSSDKSLEAKDSASIKILVNSPVRLVARWRVDLTAFYIVVGCIAAAGVAIPIMAIRFYKKREKKEETKVYEEGEEGTRPYEEGEGGTVAYE